MNNHFAAFWCFFSSVVTVGFLSLNIFRGKSLLNNDYRTEWVDTLTSYELRVLHMALSQLDIICLLSKPFTVTLYKVNGKATVVTAVMVIAVCNAKGRKENNNITSPFNASFDEYQ